MVVETPEQPRKRGHRSNEGKIQAECYAWFWNTYSRYRKLLFHVPNENDRADSNPIQGAIRKSLGVVSGVSDLILMIARGPFHGLCIEMKDEKGKQSEHQIAWQALVEAQGYKYCLCRSLAQFKQIINDYLSL